MTGSKLELARPSNSSLVPVHLRPLLGSHQIDLIDSHIGDPHLVSAETRAVPLTEMELRRLRPFTNQTDNRFIVAQTIERWEQDNGTVTRIERSLGDAENNWLGYTVETISPSGRLKMIMLPNETVWFDHIEKTTAIPTEPELLAVTGEFWEQFTAKVTGNTNADWLTPLVTEVHTRLHIDHTGKLQWQTPAELYASYFVAQIISKLTKQNGFLVERLRYEGGVGVMYGHRALQAAPTAFEPIQTPYSDWLPGPHPRAPENDTARLSDPALL